MERSSTLRGGHNIHTDQLSTPAAALALTDAYDYLSDSPLPYEVVPLLLSRPGKLMAGVLLTLRDPVDWVRSRVVHHGTKKCCKCCSVSAPPCGAKEWINASRPDYLTYYGKLSFVYKAWVACLATSQSLGFDSSNLYAFNMFARKPRDFQEGLFSALKRFVGSAAIKKRAYNRAWKKCATH